MGVGFVADLMGDALHRVLVAMTGENEWGSGSCPIGYKSSESLFWERPTGVAQRIFLFP